MDSAKKKLALHGGKPVRSALLPYGRQCLDEEDIVAVTEVLRSDWLTTGPKVAEFEAQMARFVGTKEAVAVSSGTAALHAALYALRIGPGDEVIVPAMTFAASANAVVYRGAKPIFADVDPETLLLDPQQVASLVSPQAKAILAVDYAGQPCDYDALRALAQGHGLRLIADACHSLGGAYKGASVGSLADVSALSFHAVKALTTGEGGMVTTNDAEWARRMRCFRNHGFSTDHHERQQTGAWLSEMVDIGFNYRLNDFQCALGLSQLRKLPGWIARRREIADQYHAAFADLAEVQPLLHRPETDHAYHLYVIRLRPGFLSAGRKEVFSALRAEGIGVNVHYIPVHLHLFYRKKFGTGPGLCPAAEAAYEQILSLPIFPAMTNQDVHDVIQAMRKVIQAYSKAKLFSGNDLMRAAG